MPPFREYPLNMLALSSLCSRFSIPLDENFVAETQKKWLRKPHQERWELEEIQPKDRQFVLDWAEKQGLFSAITPAQQVYDKALILGAVTPAMQRRLNYLIELWQQGTRFKEIVWLTGDRPLNNRVDDFLPICPTESDAAKLIWDKADLPLEMRALPTLFIAVPMKKEGEIVKRPNTEDTIRAWLKREANPCRALFVSDQPFCGYQFAVVKSCLPSEFNFDLVGPSFNPAAHPSAAAITLDALARWAYQEKFKSARL